MASATLRALGLAALHLVPAVANAADWYLVAKDKCVMAPKSPADLMRKFEDAGLKYDINEARGDDGHITMVTLSGPAVERLLSPTTKLWFFRGAEDCEKFREAATGLVDAIKKEHDRDLKQYE